ncbi:MAG: hypothetical protein MI748_11100 [Opitutales bacterium]|nr:hypothetical protein [Opitutales bacterium]
MNTSKPLHFMHMIMHWPQLNMHTSTSNQMHASPQSSAHSAADQHKTMQSTGSTALHYRTNGIVNSMQFKQA